MHELGLEDGLSRPDELPYGRRRLVAIARTIAAGPSVLLLDEPAAGLDLEERGELGRLVRRLADEWGLAVLLVEHDASLVLQTCDRVAVLDFGVKIAEGHPRRDRPRPRSRGRLPRLAETGRTGPSPSGASSDVVLQVEDCAQATAGWPRSATSTCLSRGGRGSAPRSRTGPGKARRS